jgi:hypothetical protein
MARTLKKSCKRTKKRRPATLAKPLAPEEIRAGEFVTALHTVYELPSFFWCADRSIMPAEEPVRIRLVARGGGKPWRVRSVCLPFVLVKSPSGREVTIDVRKWQLARLDREFARAAWKAGKRTRSVPSAGPPS